VGRSVFWQQPQRGEELRGARPPKEPLVRWHAHRMCLGRIREKRLISEAEILALGHQKAPQAAGLPGTRPAGARRKAKKPLNLSPCAPARKTRYSRTILDSGQAILEAQAESPRQGNQTKSKRKVAKKTAST
jgi:hypothetical protein